MGRTRICLATCRQTQLARGGVLVGKRHQDVHVVDWEEARVAVQHPLVPVVVDLVGQRDDIALLEAQLTLVLGVEVVECAAAGLVHRRCVGDGMGKLERSGRRSVLG